MTDEKYGPSAPSSHTFRSGLTGAPQVAGQLRSYADPAKLDRAWARLDGKLAQRRVGPNLLGHGLVRQGLAAAALLTIGVGVGMAVERAQSEPAEVALTASEVFASPTPAGRRVERRALANQEEPSKRERAVPRRRVARALAPLAEETAEEPEAALTAEDLLPPIMELAPERPAWLKLAERGEFAAAFQEIDHEGGFDSVLASGSAEELMTLADVARFAGRQGRAIQALRAVTDRYREDPNAPIAAMMLGNLLSRAGDAVGAAEAYALNRSLSPGGDFAEDALVREFDMAVRAPDVERVKRLLSQYEQEFPNGRHLEEMRSDAAELALSPGMAPKEHGPVRGSDGRGSNGKDSDGARDDLGKLPSGQGSGNGAESRRPISAGDRVSEEDPERANADEDE